MHPVREIERVKKRRTKSVKQAYVSERNELREDYNQYDNILEKKPENKYILRDFKPSEPLVATSNQIRIEKFKHSEID